MSDTPVSRTTPAWISWIPRAGFVPCLDSKCPYRRKPHFHEGPPQQPVAGGMDVNGDVEAMLNLRDWIENILKSNGCTITGSGMGFGGADLWFAHQGAEFFLTVKPVMKTTDGQECKSDGQP